MEELTVFSTVLIGMATIVLAYFICCCFNLNTRFVDPAISDSHKQQLPECKTDPRNQIADSHNREKGDSSDSRGTNRSHEQEMTMKDKFYLFLEKGFCPELEDGVEDPLYEKYGRMLKQPGSKGEDVDVGKLFCPLQGSGLSQDSNNRSMTAEELMKIVQDSGGKCPFNFGKARPELDRARNVEKCPFEYGLREEADSEDEADVPANHGADGRCPSLNRRVKMDNTLEAVKTDLHMEGNGSSMQDASNHSEAVQKDKLTPEELAQEKRAQEEQVAAILNLIVTHEGERSETSFTELQSQLKLYM